jgi:oligopeptide/dipeptide ABC transporter ATP-binding protein
MSPEPHLSLRGVSRHFQVSARRTVRAVEDIDLDIVRGETFGLVGESGCGKSTLGRTIKGIYRPSAGTVRFDGADVTRLDRGGRKGYARRMQMVFQDPYSSLNPRMTVRELIGEGLEIHGIGNRAARIAMIEDMMALVGLDPEYMNRFPHEFSGGQRQRIAIARSLVVKPEFVICDEPISALDVSIQGQIVNLLKDLQRRLGLTYLFIAHDLSMVKYISDRVGVMYLGRLVEIAPKRELFENPRHPYTQALLSSVPIPDPRRERARAESAPRGELPSAMATIAGCAFRGRCPHAHDACATMENRLTPVGPGHTVMCTLHGTPSRSGSG